MSDDTHEVTQLLHDWSGGEKQALDKLLPLVYNELRRLARTHLSRERSDHTLRTTALVHEAYLKAGRPASHELAKPRPLLRHRSASHAPHPD